MAVQQSTATATATVARGEACCPHPSLFEQAAALEAEASLYSHLPVAQPQLPLPIGPEEACRAIQPPPAAAIAEPESVMLYAYGGQGLLYCTGDPPAYAVYDRPDELEIVISTFNMVPEFGPVCCWRCAPSPPSRRRTSHRGHIRA